MQVKDLIRKIVSQWEAKVFIATLKPLLLIVSLMYVYVSADHPSLSILNLHMEIEWSYTWTRKSVYINYTFFGSDVSVVFLK